MRSTPDDITNRFHDEIEEIDRFVNFYNDQISLSEDQCESLNEIAKSIGCDSPFIVPDRTEDRTLHGVYDKIHFLTQLIRICDITKQIIELRPVILDTIKDYDYSNYRVRKKHVVESLQTHSLSDIVSMNVNSYIDLLNNSILSYNLIDKNEAGLNGQKISDCISDWLEARFMSLANFTESILKIYKKTLVSQSSFVSPYRQSFLFTVSAFDSSLFDLFRISFKKNFFRTVKLFKLYKEKVNLQNFDDYNDFSSRISYDILRTAKLAELVHILIYEVKCCSLSEDSKPKISMNPQSLDDWHSMFSERILRRNIHMHNRGIVDQHYLDKSKSKELKLGDHAEISEVYFTESKKILTWLVESFSKWVDNLPAS